MDYRHNEIVNRLSVVINELTELLTMASELASDVQDQSDPHFTETLTKE